MRFNAGCGRYVLIPLQAVRFKLDPGPRFALQASSRYAHFDPGTRICASSLIPVKAVRSDADPGRYVLIPLQAVRFKLDPGTRFALQA